MMMVNDAASFTVTLEPSITLPVLSIALLENIYSTGVTHDDNHIKNMMCLY
jgi:hypothetical protein